jgi:hypothetical protein
MHGRLHRPRSDDRVPLAPGARSRERVRMLVPPALILAVLVVLVTVVWPVVRQAPHVDAALELGLDRRAPAHGSAWPAGAHVTWSPDRERFAFEVADAETRSTSVWIARSDGTHGRPVATCTGSPCARMSDPAWSRDGGRLLVVQTEAMRADGRGHWVRGVSRLQIVDVRTGARRTVGRSADGASAYVAPRWSRDGGSIVVQVTTFRDAAAPTPSGSTVAVVSARDGTARTLTPPALRAGHPDVRRSDGLVVVVGEDPESFGLTDRPGDLWTVRLDGSGLRRLTHLPAGDPVRLGDPIWAPDGRSVQVAIGLRGAGDPARVSVHRASVAVPTGVITDSWASRARPGPRPTR